MEFQVEKPHLNILGIIIENTHDATKSFRFK